MINWSNFPFVGCRYSNWVPGSSWKKLLGPVLSCTLPWWLDAWWKGLLNPQWRSSKDPPTTQHILSRKQELCQFDNYWQTVSSVKILLADRQPNSTFIKKCQSLVFVAMSVLVETTALCNTCVYLPINLHCKTTLQYEGFALFRVFCSWNAWSNVLICFVLKSYPVDLSKHDKIIELRGHFEGR